MSFTLQTKYLAATVLNKVLPLNSIFKLLNKRYIIAYHRVVPQSKALNLRMQNSMWVSPETFSNDIDWMLKHGDIVNLDTILDFNIQNKKPLFSITFDDGWVDNYETAYPILNSYSIPATIFLVTDTVGTGNFFWVEDFLYKISAIFIDGNPEDTLHKLKLCANKYNIQACKENDELQSFAEHFIEQIKPMERNSRINILQETYKTLQLDPDPIQGEILTWDQISEMHENNIEFGSHTHTHEILQYSSEKTALNELETSKKIIDKKLNDQIKYFCYPNARYNDDSPKHVRNSGYSHAFRIHDLAVTPEMNPYLAPRFLLNETVCKNKNYLMCKLLMLPKFY